MDREQEQLQFLGFFGIIKESFNIIFSWRKIFGQITLALIVPLTFIFLAHIQVSHLLFSNIRSHQLARDHTEHGTVGYAKLSDAISSEWAVFLLFKLAYFTFLLVLSLLSTSAVVYTVASVFTAKPISFNKVISVVPRIWKRLVVTFLCSFAIVFFYNIAAFALLLLWYISIAGTTAGTVLLLLFLVFYLMGFLYITIVWHIASVVSVLEEVYGIKAMAKGRRLIKGKMGISVALFVVLGGFFLGIQFLFEALVVFGWGIDLGIRIAIGVVCFLLLLKVILFGLVSQTVLYFVCKSYHHENIDKSSLSEHLEVYVIEYVPLKAKDVQMEQV